MKEPKQKQKFFYEIGIVKGQIKRIKADHVTFSSDGVKFYLCSGLVLSVAPQKWNYIERKELVD